MGKRVLKVRGDFYKQDFQAGDIIHFVEGRYRILETNFQNEYGNFVLCEYLEEYKEEADSKVKEAIPANRENPYEIIGTIHLKGYRNLMAGPGFFVKNRQTGQIKGYSFKETMSLLFEYGATNAVGMQKVTGVFHSSIIDSIEGLPSFDSQYWKILAYNEKGEPFAELTDSAKKEIHKALEYMKRRK
jgi:hypothetical protein